jgi:hypothetical protein
MQSADESVSATRPLTRDVRPLGTALVMIKTGIEISVIYADKDLLELRVQASNGVFRGQAEVYADLETLKKFANLLCEFPANNGDTREFELGTFDAAYAGGGAGFRFYCLDSVGHLLAEVKLRTDPRLRAGTSDVAMIHISVEAGGIDSFVGELEQMTPEVGQNAVLKGAA